MSGRATLARPDFAWPLPDDALARNALGLIFGKAAQLGLGFAFWVIAARLFDEAAVGLAAGAVSATMLAVQFSLVGVDAAFIKMYPSRTDRYGSLVATALAAVLVAAMVTAAVILGIAAMVSGDFHDLVANRTLGLCFVIATIIGTWVTLFERMSLARRRGSEVTTRSIVNGVVSILPFALVMALWDSAGSNALFSFWLGGIAAAFVLGVVHNRPARDDLASARRLTVDPALARGLVRVGFPNHVLSSFERLPILLTPVIVLNLLGKVPSAHWYTAWQMAFAVYAVPISCGMALFAEGAHNPDRIRQDSRQAIRLALAIAIPLSLIAAAVAPFMLGLVGSSYADAGTKPLRILLLGVIPFVFVQTYFATCRAMHRLGEAAIVAALIATGIIGATYRFGPDHGLEAIAIAWVAALYVAAIWADYRRRFILRPSGVDS